MRLIEKTWAELIDYEKQHPANPDEIFVVGACQPNWPPFAVMRARGKIDTHDHTHIGLFWEWEHAVQFAQMLEKKDGDGSE